MRYAAALAFAVVAVPIRAQRELYDELVDDAVESVLAPVADPAARRVAAEELARLGPRAGERLVERWLRQLTDAPGPGQLRRAHWAVQRGVMQALLALGPGSQRAAWALRAEAETLRWNTALFALQVLAEVAPWHPELAAKLREVPEPDINRLRRLAPPGLSESAVNDALEWLVGPQRTAWHRLQIRCAIDPRAPEESLIQLLTDGNVTEMVFAAQILARRGPAARATAPVLAEAMERAQRGDYRMEPLDSPGYGNWLFRSACEALVAVAPEDPLSIPAHCFLLAADDSTTEERRASARALAGFGAKAAPAVDALIRVRDRYWDDDALIVDVVAALGRIGPAARSAAPMLRKLCDEVFWNAELVAHAQRAWAAVDGRR